MKNEGVPKDGLDESSTYETRQYTIEELKEINKDLERKLAASEELVSDLKCKLSDSEELNCELESKGVSSDDLICELVIKLVAYEKEIRRLKAIINNNLVL